jgi:hypothetical protein
MVSPAMAQELVDRVIDFLHDDSASLRVCALVHSHFRAPSQLHLFNKVTLRNLASVTPLGAALQHTPALARYIRELQLMNHNLLGIHMALCALPRLRTLRLDLLTESSTPPTWPEASILRGSASATRLVLGLVVLTDMTQFAALVNALPAVTELAFSVRVHVGSLDLRGLDPPAPGLRLLRLDLRGIVNRQLLATLAEWLCASGRKTLINLQSLCINMHLVPPTMLLQSAAPSLQHLLFHHIAGQHGRHFHQHQCAHILSKTRLPSRQPRPRADHAPCAAMSAADQRQHLQPVHRQR